MLAGALVEVAVELQDALLDLGAKVRQVERLVVDDFSTVGAVPPDLVIDARRPVLLEHNANGVGVADRVVWDVAWQQERVALVDGDVLKLAVVHHLDRHVALVHVEPLGGLVDVVVGTLVGTSHDLQHVSPAVPADKQAKYAPSR